MTCVTALADDFETRICRRTETAACTHRSDRAFAAISTLVFAICAAVTIVLCSSMPENRGMPMPGRWTLSMAWMRMPGQPWLLSAASFLGMWVAMMAAMMLPSFAPVLRRYRRSVSRTCEARLGVLTALVALGYFSVWSLVGLAVFPLGLGAAALEMKHPALARSVPMAAGIVVLLAGALQFTKWKAHRLASCREAPGCGRTIPPDARMAWRQGIHSGLHCSLCCANLTAVLLVVGVMNLRAMAAMTAAITAERLAPDGPRLARTIGLVLIGLALFLMVRAGGLG